VYIGQWIYFLSVQVFFIHYRIYLILEKMKIIAYRNLFKKV